MVCAYAFGSYGAYGPMALAADLQLRMLSELLGRDPSDQDNGSEFVAVHSEKTNRGRATERGRETERERERETERQRRKEQALLLVVRTRCLLSCSSW